MQVEFSYLENLAMPLNVSSENSCFNYDIAPRWVNLTVRREDSWNRTQSGKELAFCVGAMRKMTVVEEGHEP